MPNFCARLASGPPLLLDGATGTELNRRGVDTALPLWSARALLEAPDELLAVHRDYVAAGVDVLLVETMNTVREAAAAARAAVRTGKPTIVSFVCGRDGRLLSGESVRDAATEIAALKAAVLAVNCAPAPDLVTALTELSTAVALPFGAYGNVGCADDEQGWVNTDSVEPEVYARYAADWLRLGACLVGSCCGTGPAHTRALRQLIDAAR